MMKWLFYSLLALVVVVVLTALTLSWRSQQGSAPGLWQGRLSRCPATPNCVCSEYPGEAAFIPPLTYTGEAEEAWRRLQVVLVDAGGRVEQLQGDYLAASFRTPWLHFVDDLELRLDRQAGVIHIRSASRVGKGDMGVNRARVETLRTAFSPRRPAA